MRYSLMTLILLLVLSSAAHSQSGALPGQESLATVSPPMGVFADKVTLEAAVRKVRKQYGGRILSAETRGSGARRQHVIKVLTDEGKVRTVRINAN